MTVIMCDVALYHANIYIIIFNHSIGDGLTSVTIILRAVNVVFNYG
jgi:hypothetical protein